MQAAGKLRNLNSRDAAYLMKKWKYYLKKLTAQKSCLSKSISVFSLALALTLNAQSQCTNFAKNKHYNPVQRIMPIRFNKYFPQFVDIDNDGDLDCYTTRYESGEFRFTLSRNEGNIGYPFFKDDTTSAATGFKITELNEIDILGNGRSQPQFVDIDGDGDYDCFLVAYHRDFGTFLVYFENKGTPEQPSFSRSVTSPLNISSRDYFFTYAIADMDGDGDYDCITVDIYYHKTYLSNTGTKTTPHFSYAADPFPGLFVAYPSFYDWNHDGLADCIDGYYYYENVGTVGNPYFVETRVNAPKVKMYDIVSWVDLNNDGFPEVYSRESEMHSTAPDSYIENTYKGTPNDTLAFLQAYPKGSGYSYEWRRNGKVLDNSAKDSILVTKPGTYIVNVRGNCGTGISKPFILKGVQQLNSLSVSDNVSAPAQTFKIYPNPSTDKFYIKLPDHGIKEFFIKITDLRGVVVYANKVSGSEIYVGEHFKPGVYFAEVISDKKTVYRQKVVKQ